MRCIRRLLYEEGLYLECPVIVFVCLLYHCVFKEVWGGSVHAHGETQLCVIVKASVMDGYGRTWSQPLLERAWNNSASDCPCSVWQWATCGSDTHHLLVSLIRMKIQPCHSSSTVGAFSFRPLCVFRQWWPSQSDTCNWELFISSRDRCLSEIEYIQLPTDLLKL